MEYLCARMARAGALAVLAACAAAFMLGGCGLTTAQRSAAALFGAAAADLGAIAGEEFIQSRLNVIAMNTRRLGLGDETVSGTALDGYFRLEDVRARVETCEALRRYGLLLERLANGSEEGEAAGAAARLVESLERLRSTGRLELSDARLGAIGRAVAGAGGTWIESRRARAVRETMDASGPVVRRVAELIARDFDPEGEHWSLGFEASAARLAERAADVRSDLKGKGGAEARGQREGQGRIAGLALVAEAEALAAAGRERFAEIGARIGASSAALAGAEKNVRAVLDGGPGDDGVESLEEFTASVSELVVTYRVLRR